LKRYAASSQWRAAACGRVPTRRQRVRAHRGQGEIPRNDQRGLTYAATPASDLIGGTASIEDVGWELFHLMLGVARGRKQTWAKRWQPHHARVLFNPAPVT
jgi:altronate dehydratase